MMEPGTSTEQECQVDIICSQQSERYQSGPDNTIPHHTHMWRFYLKAGPIHHNTTVWNIYTMVWQNHGVPFIFKCMLETVPVVSLSCPCSKRSSN